MKKVIIFFTRKGSLDVSLDVSNRSGGILVYVKSSIPSRRLSCDNLCDSIQAVPFEINLRKEKWLVISIFFFLIGIRSMQG